MGYYEDVYLKRLNRYGNDFQARLQGQREENFSHQLKKSIYYVTFTYNGMAREGELTPRKTNETKTLQYLLTDINLKMPAGTIVTIPNDAGADVHWMVYYLENLQASGYNRYTVIKMTHYITWTRADKTTRSSWGYLYGQEDNMLKNELKSRSRNRTIYLENLKLNFIVMPLDIDIAIDDYIEIQVETLTESYRVTGYDRLSTPGVEFISIDPVYTYDLTEDPKKAEGDSDSDFFWLGEV